MIGGRIIQRTAAETQHTPLPVIGKVKVGEKATTAGGKEYPKGLGHFRVTGSYVEEFTAAYGEAPERLPIVFASDVLQVSCFERYEARDEKTGRKVGVSDGQNVMIWAGDRMIRVSPEDERVKTVGKWKAALTLRFLLPEIKGILGLWEFTTYGEQSSIPQIRETFDYVQENAGTVKGLPFDLLVTLHRSDNAGQARQYPVVSLVSNLSADNMDKVRAFVDSGHVLPSHVSPELLQAMPDPNRQLLEGGSNE